MFIKRHDSPFPHQTCHIRKPALHRGGKTRDLYTNRPQFVSVSRSLPLFSSCYINKNASGLFFQISIYIKKSFYINTSMRLFLPSWKYFGEVKAQNLCTFIIYLPNKTSQFFPISFGRPRFYLFRSLHSHLFVSMFTAYPLRIDSLPTHIIF